MQIINNVCIFYIGRAAIYQWRWWIRIWMKISNSLKEMNVFINNIDEQSAGQWIYGVTECTNELTHSQITSNINLLLQRNEWVNLFIHLNEHNLS